MGRDQIHIPEKRRKNKQVKHSTIKSRNTTADSDQYKDDFGIWVSDVDELIEKRMRKAGSWKGTKWVKEGKKRFK